MCICCKWVEILCTSTPYSRRRIINILHASGTLCYSRQTAGLKRETRASATKGGVHCTVGTGTDRPWMRWEHSSAWRRRDRVSSTPDGLMQKPLLVHLPTGSGRAKEAWVEKSTFDICAADDSHIRSSLAFLWKEEKEKKRKREHVRPGLDLIPQFVPLFPLLPFPPFIPPLFNPRFRFHSLPLSLPLSFHPPPPPPPPRPCWIS